MDFLSGEDETESRPSSTATPILPYRIPIIHKITDGESTADIADIVDTAVESEAEITDGGETNDVNKPEEQEENFGSSAAESNIVPQYVEYGKPSVPVKKIKKQTVNHISSTNKKPIADKMGMGTGNESEDNKQDESEYILRIKIN